MIWNGFSEHIHSELQGPKESTSAGYFFLCLKLVSNVCVIVSCRCALALTVLRNHVYLENLEISKSWLCNMCTSPSINLVSDHDVGEVMIMHDDDEVMFMVRSWYFIKAEPADRIQICIACFLPLLQLSRNLTVKYGSETSGCDATTAGGFGAIIHNCSAVQPTASFQKRRKNIF